MNIKRDYYYRTYKKEIRGAFSEKGRERLLVKLIDATILFNQNKFEKAIKKLSCALQHRRAFFRSQGGPFPRQAGRERTVTHGQNDGKHPAWKHTGSYYTLY